MKPIEGMKMEWISVNDHLPEEGKRVLSFLKFQEEIKVDYVIYAYKPIWACTMHREENKVTHWMPLPQPPKDE